jgi:hypothetical protein
MVSPPLVAEGFCAWRRPPRSNPGLQGGRNRILGALAPMAISAPAFGREFWHCHDRFSGDAGKHPSFTKGVD